MVVLDEDRPRPLVAARLGGLAQRFGRVGQRHERAARRAQHGVRRAEGALERLLAGAAEGRRVRDLDGDPPQRLGERLAADVDRSLEAAHGERPRPDLALDPLLPPVALDDLQEAHAHVDLVVALEQALGAHDPAIVGVALAVSAREDAAERPAPLVLERRPAIRPEQVALVEHRVGDPADRVH